MTATIAKLPRNVVDRIAAGEVVERPASVVKELVENSLDAGATRVDVEVSAGGRDLIRVRDDGIGMGAEDLALAFASHATSKLSDVPDLDHIASFGFRGEALASIGAVADCRILARARGDVHGHEIENRGGVLGEVTAAASTEGALIEIRNLFKYVPARRKFLRTPATEMAHVTAVMHEAALAHPEVGFSLVHDGRKVFRVAPQDDRRERLGRFFGGDLARALLEVDGELGGLRLHGFVARPEVARKTSKAQYLFLNGRPVRDRSVFHAVRHAYEGLLMTGRHPVVFLFLSVDPSQVDVNVHPAKREVRFRDGQLVHRLVRRAVRETLLAADLKPNALNLGGGGEGGDAGAAAPTALPTAATGERYLDGVRDALAGFLAAPPPGKPDYSSYRAGGSPEPGSPAGSAPSLHEQAQARRTRNYLQVQNTYLVFEGPDGLVIVDQHALHERIRLEELQLRVREGTLEVQSLLVPALVELPAADVELVLAAAEELVKLGLRVERFGETTLALQSLPVMLSSRDPAQLVRDLADRLRDGKGAGDRGQLVEHLMHSMACRGAIMAGDPLTEVQAAELMRRADLIENAHSCAHGRPTGLVISYGDLERRFGRQG